MQHPNKKKRRKKNNPTSKKRRRRKGEERKKNVRKREMEGDGEEALKPPNTALR